MGTIERTEYLNRIKNLKDTPDIKVITGIRKSGKLSIPWWRSHPIHENRATESICTEPCNPLLRATKSMKRATSTY